MFLDTERRVRTNRVKQAQEFRNAGLSGYHKLSAISLTNAGPR